MATYKRDFILSGGIGLSANNIYLSSATNSTTISTGALILSGGAGIAQSLSIGGSLQIFNGSNFTAFKASSASNNIYTLPNQYPAIGTSVLQSNTSGEMSWAPMIASSSSGNTTQNIAINTAGNANVFHPVLLTPSALSAGSAVSADTTITFNPSTEILYVSGLAITAQTASTSSTLGALVVSGGVGIGGSLYVASATGISGVTINNGVVTGNLTGTASTATYAHQAGYAITSGSASIATTATYAHQSGYAITSGSASIATTATYAHQAGYAITSGSASIATTATYAHQSGYAITSGSASIATTATYAHQSGYAITSGSASIATSSFNISLQNGFNNTSHSVIFSLTASGSGIALSTNQTVTYNPFTSVLSVSGVAVTSNTNSVSSITGAAIVTGGVGIGQSISVGGRLQLFNSSNYTAFVSSATGNTVYTLPATSPAIGSSVLQSNSAGVLSWVPLVASGGDTYLVDVNAATGNTVLFIAGLNDDIGSGLAVSSNTNLTYDTNTNTLNSPVYNGTWAGFTITSFYGGTGHSTYTVGDLLVGAGGTLAKLAAGLSGYVLTSNGAGTVPSWQAVPPAAASSVAVTTSILDQSFFITFVNTSSGSGLGLTTATSFVINPSSGLVTASGLALTNLSNSTSTTSGALRVSGGLGLTGNAFIGGTINAPSINQSNISNVYFTNGNITGTSVTATTIQGTLVGTAITATNIYLASTGNVAGPFYLTMSSGSSGSGLALSTDTSLAYNSATDVLTVSNISGSAITASTSFSGQLFGNVTGIATTSTYSYQAGYGITAGIATTATNINVSNATTNAAHPMFFGPIATGSGVAVSSNTTLSYNPSSFILSTSGLAVTATTISTNTASGALVVSGGVGIGGTIFVGGDVFISSATASTSAASGALRVQGGLGVSGQLSFNQAALGFTGAVSPSIAFIGGTTGTPITMTVLSDNSLIFEGTSGKLFGINNNLSSGWIFNVGDISGLPLLRANADGNVAMAEFAGNVGIGLSNPAYKLHVTGSVGFTSSVGSSTVTTGALIVSGGVGIGNSLSVGGRLQLFNGSNFTAFVSSATGNTVYTLPATSPATGSSVLSSTSGGVLSWVPMTSGSSSGTVNAGTANFAAYYATSTSAVSENANLQFTGTGLSVGGNINSSSTKSGALYVNGGLGVTGNAFIGGTTTIQSSASSISSSTGSLVVSGGVGIGGSLNVGNTSSFEANTASVSTSTGAVVVSGGVGVGGSLYVGGSSRFSDSSQSNTINSGAIVVTGGAGIAQSVSIGGRLQLFNGANYTSFVSSASGNTVYTLPATSPAIGTSYLVSTSAGVMSWTRPKRSYVLSFGAGFTPIANAADTIQLNIPYAPDNVSLNYFVKRIEYRNETLSGGTGLSFYLQRHTSGNASWTTTNTITAGLGASFEVGASTYASSFTTISSSSGIAGSVISGDYVRLFFTTVGSAADVSISMIIEEQ